MSYKYYKNQTYLIASISGINMGYIQCPNSIYIQR